MYLASWTDRIKEEGEMVSIAECEYVLYEQEVKTIPKCTKTNLSYLVFALSSC